MIVSKDTFDEALADLSNADQIAVDTETTGLTPFHGSRFFAIVIASGERSYYFNFSHNADVPSEFRLDDSHLARVRSFLSLLSKETRCYMHNAKFDLAILRNGGIEVGASVYDTKVMARLIYNDRYSGFGLKELAEDVGKEKLDTAADYAKEHNIADWSLIPFSIMSEYATMDGEITLALGKQYKNVISEISSQLYPDPDHSLNTVMENEARLTKVIHDMQGRGVLIDLDYCERGSRRMMGFMIDAASHFGEMTGKVFKVSSKLFKEVFVNEDLEYNAPTKTGKINPKFDMESLLKFKSDAAKLVVEYMKAKATFNFFENITKHTDYGSVLHANLNQDGTITGRFSSSDPNLQNLSKVNADKTFPVRRAIIPREGYFFAMFDMDQAEYRLMLDYACHMQKMVSPLAKSVLGGLDVHEATARLAGIDRTTAKTTNFLLLYGGGVTKLAKDLGIDYAKAKAIRDAIFNAAPEIETFIHTVQSIAEKRGWIRNWLGRRALFQDPQDAYKAPNTLIQGGVADVIKVGMVLCYDFLKDFKSQMVLNIHDEIVIECHESEKHLLPEIKKILESVYKPYCIPLTFGCDHSYQSLADKIKGYPP